MCVIDFGFPTEKVFEIPVPKEQNLGAVLKASGRKRLMEWEGVGGRSICVIKQHAILERTGRRDFLLTPIDPGDFIIFQPQE
jgi:hypothetical protein